MAYVSGYTKRVPLTIDKDLVGAGGVTDFPWLPPLTLPDAVAAACLEDLSDVRFAADDGTVYNHELVDGSASGKTMLAWVKVPSISSAVDTVVYLNYGKADATMPDSASQQATWNTRRARWHLNESSGTFADATGNGFAGTEVGTNGTMTRGEVGVVGTCIQLNNTALKNSKGISTALTDTLGDFTAAAWFKVHAAITFSRILDKDYAVGFWMGRNVASANSFGGGIRQSGNPFGQYLAATDGNWHYIAMMRAGTTHTLFVDGTSSSQSGNGDALSNTALSIGINPSTNEPFDGWLDEISIAADDLGVATLTTEYNNQLSPATFAAWGTPEVAAGVRPLICQGGTVGRSLINRSLIA